MGKNMRRLLKLAIDKPGWHNYGTERGERDAVAKLVEYGFVEANDRRQFRLIGNDMLFRVVQDVNDMHESKRTQFARCKCGHLYDKDLHCMNCEPLPEIGRPSRLVRKEFGGLGYDT